MAFVYGFLSAEKCLNWRYLNISLKTGGETAEARNFSSPNLLMTALYALEEAFICIYCYLQRVVN